MVSPTSMAPPIPSHNAPPIPSHNAPPIPRHNAPPIPRHTTPPPLPPHASPPPLPPKRTVTNEGSPLQESRVTGPAEDLEEKEMESYNQALPDIYPNFPLRRTSSDTSIVSHRSEISEKHRFSPAPIIGGDRYVCLCVCVFMCISAGRLIMIFTVLSFLASKPSHF